MLGKMFDDLFEDNMMQLSEMQEKAVKFVHQHTGSQQPFDFNFFMTYHNQNPGFDFQQHIL